MSNFASRKQGMDKLNGEGDRGDPVPREIVHDGPVDGTVVGPSVALKNVIT